jgi:hypothetical protein
LKVSFLVLVALLHAAEVAAYTYPELVRQLTDLERLSVLPESGERSRESTSRDRASAYQSGTGTYQNWSANGDGTGFLADNGDGGKIMAQVSGPGVIWRIWTARPNSGSVKIFLDGSAVPAVDLPFREYFDRSRSPFDYESLVYAAAGGWNNYVPIPFQASCKVVAYGDWGQYYHIGYSTFPAETVVPSFTMNLAQADRDALATADTFFKTRLGSDPAGNRGGQITDSLNYTLNAGQSVTPLEVSEQGAITGIRIRVNGLASKAEQWAALRELTIRMHWDGETSPAVWAPLGDFFGSACGFNVYQSLPLGMQEDGWMYAHWYMPFASAARIVIQNDGSKARALEVRVTRAPLTQAVENLARFHAKWNRNAFPVTGSDRWPDYTVLKTAGRGRFLGFMLHLFKPVDGEDPQSSPGNYWWGEGDEKFFVDNEKIPSWFGTGSEDYFGYAWATPDYFSKPFHSQLCFEGGIQLKGNRSLNRFQITDNVPFQQSFEASLEKYYSDTHARYAVMPYWYLAAGGTDAYAAVSVADRTGYYESPAPRDTSRIEGEDLAILSASQGSLYSQDMAGFGTSWSNRQHLLWFKNNLTDVQAGATGRLGFSTNPGGSFRVRVAFTKAPDFGILQLRVDGNLCGGSNDLYGGSVTRAAEVEPCTVDLSSGKHELRLTVTGKNAASSGHYMGMDYLRLIPVITGVSTPALPVGNLQPLLGKISLEAGGMRCPVATRVNSAVISDFRGVRLRSLVPFEGHVVWDGRDHKGRKVRGGAYLINVTGEGERRAVSFVLLP